MHRCQFNDNLLANLITFCFLKLQHVNYLKTQYSNLSTTFPGLVLPNLVEAVDAFFAPVISEDDCEQSSIASSIEAAAADIDLNINIEANNDLNLDEYYEDQMSEDPSCEGDFLFVDAEYLDGICFEKLEKWEDLLSVLQAEAEAAALLPLNTEAGREEFRSLPNYADEIVDLEKWLARFRYAIGNRQYFKNWPQGDEEAEAILNGGECLEPLLPSQEQMAKHLKSIQFDEEFPAPAGVEEFAIGAGWNLEEASDSDFEIEDVDVDVDGLIQANNRRNTLHLDKYDEGQFSEDSFCEGGSIDNDSVVDAAAAATGAEEATSTNCELELPLNLFAFLDNAVPEVDSGNYSIERESKKGKQ